MIGRQYRGGSVDEVAVRRDDELLLLLGRRLTTPPAADPATALLRALTDDVDREVAAIAAPASVPVNAIDSLRTRRRKGARGTVVGVVVLATLSVSGVAAAVTGDPLSPYRAVLSLGQDDDPPAPRRAARPDVVRREGTPTQPPGGGVTAIDVAMGRAGVAAAQVSGRGPADRTHTAGKPSKADRSSDRPDSAAGQPVNPGSSADRAKEAKVAKAERLDRADRADKPVEGSDGASGPQRARASRPEQKEERDKP